MITNQTASWIKNTKKKAIASSIAHEIRSPLSQVRRSLELADRELSGLAGEVSLERVKGLMESGQRAVSRGERVVDMILDEVRGRPVEASALVGTSLSSLTERALSEYGYVDDAERGKVYFHRGADFLARVDETLYAFVVFNLLKNALYYGVSRDDFRVDISLKREADAGCLLFRDNGPGVPEERLERIFDGFSTFGKSGGSGLGLAYCRRVMRAFGGDIICRSIVDEYTEFELRFPAVVAVDCNENASTSLQHCRPVFHEISILVVDDDALQRQMLCRQLASLGACARVATNGREALALIREQPFDLVVMDLNMPEMTGDDAIRRLRAGEAGVASQHVPVVALTSEHADAARARIGSADVQALLSKPLATSKLVEVLEVLLAAAAPSEATNLAGAQVLLLDDDAFSVDMTAVLLRDEGLAVRCATTVKQAKEILAGGGCDLLVTDLHMPDASGEEIARWVREQAGLAAMPIIGLSGDSDPVVVERARRAGMNDYLVKPVSMPDLIKAIASALPPAGDRKPAPVRATATARLCFEKMPLRRFAEEYAHVGAELRQKAAGDLRGLSELAHKLKGALALCGEGSLSEMAHLLEKACREGDSGAVDLRVSALAEGIANLVKPFAPSR